MVVVTIPFLLVALPCLSSFKLFSQPRLLQRPYNNVLLQKVDFQSSSSSSLLRHLPLHFRVSDNDEGDSTAAGGNAFVKDEEEEEEEEDSDELEKSNRGKAKNPSMLRKLSRGIIPLAASLGFAVTPSPSVAVRIAGAAAGGVAGAVVRKIILSRERPAISPETAYVGVPNKVKNAAKALEGISVLSLDLKGLEKIAKKHGLSPNELSFFFTLAFSEAIVEAVQSTSMDLTELQDVLDYAQSIGFTESEIGNAFSLAAVKIGKQLDKDERGIYVVEYPVDVYLQAAKVFFLADKMIGSLKGFYGKRTLVALSYFTDEQYQKTISESCTKLFRRCIESVLVDPEAFTIDEINNLQGYLTTTASVSSLRPANMQNMIMEAIQFLLDSSLKKESVTPMNAVVEGFDNLRKAQEVLGWNYREFQATVELRTLPLFEDVASDLINAVVDKPDKAVELAAQIEERVKALSVDEQKARVILTNLMSKLNNEYMTRLDKVYNVSQGAIEPVFKIMVGFAHTHDALNTLVRNVLNGTELPLPGLPFADMVRASIYELQLQKGQQGKPIVDAEMFDLTPGQQQLVRKNMALPKVTTWITQCIAEGNFNDGARDAYRKILEEYKVGDREWAATAVDFYYQEASRISNSKAVPSVDDMARLSALRSFLSCTDSAVTKVHLELFGDKYAKALSEAMGPTGVIAEEYVPGLERLRDRLQLTPEQAEALLSVVARQRVIPIVKNLVDVWKSDTDANYRREKEKKEGKDKNAKDKSRDPISSPDNVFGYMEMGAAKEGGGPNVFMREVVNLVDFVQENFVLHGVDIAAKENLPVTAVGVVTEEDLVGIYKHFLISRLAETDPALKSRYEEVEELYAKILGIEEESQAKAKESLAFNAYKNLLKHVLTYKPAVEPQDIQQFAFLKESLSLNDDAASEIFMNACKGAVLDHAARLVKDNYFGRPFTPESARTFREQVSFQHRILS